MIIETFNTTKVFIDGVLYPKIFISKSYRGDLIQIQSIFTKKRFGKIEEYGNIMIDGTTYTNLIDTISVLNSVIFPPKGFGDYYQWLPLGLDDDLINQGTGDVDGLLISGSMIIKDIVFDWIRGDVGLQAVADKYSIPYILTYEQMLAIDFSVIDEDDLRVTFENGVFKDWAVQPYESEPLKDVNGEILYDVNGEKLYPLKEF